MNIPCIPGLRYIPNITTNQHASRTIEAINRLQWDNSLSRRVQHYGYKYDYRNRSVSKDDYLGPFPEFLAKAARSLSNLFPSTPDQIIINEYLPGQGIANHIDCPPCFGPTVASLSLGSGCIMELSKSGTIYPIYLEPNSLLILSGDARSCWYHGIPQRAVDIVEGQRIPRSTRISLTFRTVKLS